MLLLQVEQVSTTLSQYGILGLFAGLLILVVLYLEKHRKKVEEDSSRERDELRANAKHLEERFNEYQKVDRTVMQQLIQKNIDVMTAVERHLDKMK